MCSGCCAADYPGFVNGDRPIGPAADPLAWLDATRIELRCFGVSMLVSRAQLAQIHAAIGAFLDPTYETPQPPDGRRSDIAPTREVITEHFTVRALRMRSRNL